MLRMALFISIAYGKEKTNVEAFNFETGSPFARLMHNLNHAVLPSHHIRAARHLRYGSS
jgi:hypothetical protein